MNFDVIKTILPNSSYDLDNLQRKYGHELAGKRLFGSMVKLIKILSYCDEGAIIMERKRKEKRVAGLNHIINKCKKVKRKQENKIIKLESKIADINQEPDFAEEPEVSIHESKMVLIGVDQETHNSVLAELDETKKRLEQLNLKLMVKEHLQKTVGPPTVELMTVDHVHESKLAAIQITSSSKCESGTQSDNNIHDHNDTCTECVSFSIKVRKDRFGDEKTALDVMSRLNKHNFMQPNKHETILLVKKAMLDIKNNIKHKFSLFLANKMMELCDLLLFAFNQMEKLRQMEMDQVRMKLNELK